MTRQEITEFYREHHRRREDAFLEEYAACSDIPVTPFVIPGEDPEAIYLAYMDQVAGLYGAVPAGNRPASSRRITASCSKEPANSRNQQNNKKKI